MTFAVHDKVRVKANADFLVGVVGEIVAIDEERRLPYVVEHLVEGSPRAHCFAESELERAPIETKVVEGVIGDGEMGRCVGLTLLDEILDDYEQGNEVRIIVELVRRVGER